MGVAGPLVGAGLGTLASGPLANLVDGDRNDSEPWVYLLAGALMFAPALGFAFSGLSVAGRPASAWPRALVTLAVVAAPLLLALLVEARR